LFETILTLGSFTSPTNVGMNPQSMLWLLPLVAALSVVYKTLKLRDIKPGNFIKEVVTVFGSIVLFTVIAAGILLFLSWLATG